MQGINPLITVTIPIYKSEKYIRRCLKSVFAQTYPNIEILLINDHTSDDSLRIIEETVPHQPGHYVRVLHNSKNGGLSVVRNRGIDEAEGEYLYFMDSDDELLPDCIEKLYDLLLSQNVQMAVGRNIFVSDGDRTPVTTEFPLKNCIALHNNEEVFDAYLAGEIPVTAWNKLFRTSYLREKELYFLPGIFSQDELWSFKVMQQLESIAFLHEVTYRYYLHADSVIHNRSRVNFINYFTVLQHFAKDFHAEKSSVRKHKILSKIVDFKEMVLIFLWKTFPADRPYFTEFVAQYASLPKLTFSDYLSNKFSRRIKLLNAYHQLPPMLHYLIFKKRFTGRF